MIACISQVTTLSTPFEDDIGAFARAGWPAVEVWLTKLETFVQGRSAADAGRLLREEGITPMAAALQGGLVGGRPEARSTHFDHFRRRLDLLAEVSVPTLIASCDFAEEPEGATIAEAIEMLGGAAEEARSRGIRIALEGPKSSRFGGSLDTLLAIVAQTDSTSLGVCLDVFHFMTGPSKMEDLSLLTAEMLAWVQVSDLSGVPRELARDSDRILPGDGDFPLVSVLDRVRSVGYEGGISVEVPSPALRDVPAAIAADAALRSLARVLDSLTVAPPTSAPEA